MEEARRPAEGDLGEEPGNREQAALAEERPELGQGDEEGDEVDEPQRTLQREARQPVVGRREPLDSRSLARQDWAEGTSQITASGGRVSAAECCSGPQGTGSASTSPLPAPLPANSAESVLSTSRQRPPAGRPTR